MTDESKKREMTDYLCLAVTLKAGNTDKGEIAMCLLACACNAMRESGNKALDEKATHLIAIVQNDAQVVVIQFGDDLHQSEDKRKAMS